MRARAPFGDPVPSDISRSPQASCPLAKPQLTASRHDFVDALQGRLSAEISRAICSRSGKIEARLESHVHPVPQHDSAQPKDVASGARHGENELVAAPSDIGCIGGLLHGGREVGESRECALQS